MLDVESEQTSERTDVEQGQCRCSRRQLERRFHRDEAVAILVHELRAPLSAIILALSAIPDGGEARAIAERQTWRAARIVDDVFDLCAGSRGTLTVCKEVVQLDEVVARAVEAARPQFVAAGHRLLVSLPPGPFLVLADPMRLEQVLTNLLVNAAKFTDPNGQIRLTATVEGDENVLRVCDSGWGIAPQLLPRVFEPFVHGAVVGSSTGLGVGLALVKSLVEAHGGRVTVTSNGPGTGAEFVVRLPAGSGDIFTGGGSCIPPMEF